MTTIINGSSPSITFSDGSAQTSATRPFQNRIINGAMTIDQRNAGASKAIATGVDSFTLDRWYFNNQTDGAFTVQQSSTAPVGFSNSLLLTVTTQDSSLAAGQYCFMQQGIEGFNVADLGWGTADAKTITMSFWVRSSLTGTFGGSLRNNDSNRSYPFTYTISVADTFEYKTVTVAGDTTGTWLKDNRSGIQLEMGIGVGSTFSGTAGAWAASNFLSATGATNILGTNGATWYLTGFQLEVGSTATSFDYRPYGTEFDMCRRYCEVWGNSATTTVLTLVGPNPNNNAQIAGAFTCYAKRVAPTMTSGAANTFRINWQGGDATPQSVDFGGNVTLNINTIISSSSNPGAYASRLFLTSGSISTNFIIASAEL